MLAPDELLTSEVVANATMNRGRGLAGVNSYQKELRFDVAAFLQTRVKDQGHAVWYDACCGSGLALTEVAERFGQTDWGGQVELIGTDLVDMFPVGLPPSVQLRTGDVTQLALETPADLVTCVHGLHYLGDKLGFLEQAYQNLAPGGLFLGHLDKTNLRLPMPWSRLLKQTRAQGIDVDFRTQLLRIQRKDQPLRFGMSYQGATVSEKPNYTGITVIDSWYLPQPG